MGHSYDPPAGNPSRVVATNIIDRRGPVPNHGDPLKNGLDVWPRDAKTFVSGNEVYGDFNKTWDTLFRVALVAFRSH